MIIILSSITDLSTQKVIEWLKYHKKDFVIINDTNEVKNLEILIQKNKSELYFSVSNRNIKLENITSFWYRRENMSIISPKNEHIYPPIFETKFTEFKNLENIKLKEYLSFKLKAKSKINDEEDCTINKLVVLEFAIKVGLLIPTTFITNHFKEYFRNKKLVLKPIGETINFFYSNNMCRLLTHEFEAKHFTSYFPTLLQTKIDKLFEIRAFFLGNKFYSIAIFSQQNSKSKLDYRNYDFLNNNRSVPFSLPKEMVVKCRKLMKLLKLNSGSLDLIYTKTNEFIFLEVNPIGQFDNVSKVGNYYLEI